MSIVNWVISNKAIILGVALSISEILALLDPAATKSGIFQSIVSWIKKASAPSA